MRSEIALDTIVADDPLVRVETPLGAIVLRVAASQAPLSAAAFLAIVDENPAGLDFWRAADRTGGDGRVALHLVQGGTTEMARFPRVGHEPTSLTGLRHLTGTVSLGRIEPGSAVGAAFFVCLADHPQLDAGGEANADGLGYAAFGMVEEGLEVAQAIQAMPRSDVAPIPAFAGQMLRDPVPILAMRRVAAAVTGGAHAQP